MGLNLKGGKMPRIIQCCDCLSAELLPDFLGTKQEQAFDPLVDIIAASHRGPLNRVQLHNRPNNAPRLRQFPDTVGVCDLCNGSGCLPCKGTGQLPQAPHLLRGHQIAPKDWANPKIRDAFLRQMWEREGHVGYPDEFYAAKDTFTEDAAACFEHHGRPQQYCIDWENDSKRLTDKRWKERDIESRRKLTELGIDPPGGEHGSVRKDVFLCHFCKVSSYVTFKKREQRGLYDG